MPTVAKKSTPKASSRANGAATRSHPATHPTWVDMIKECIVDNPGDARVGVSRPMIKKFVENKYHIDLNPLTASQLNRAITSGSDKGIFQLPKGPSGKVKLAPKSRSATTKENTKPPSKKPTLKVVTTKAKGTAAKAPARVTIRAPPKPRALNTSTKAKLVKPATRTAKKSTSTPKKAPVKKLATTMKKKAPVPKKSISTKKKTTAKRGAAKKAATGKGKRLVSKPKSKSSAANAKASKAKAKPVSQTKPTSKTKASSKTVA